jgi:uncharacterized protein (DUF3084 family)
MNMAPYLPPASTDATDTVFALLKVLADPTAAQKLLEELVAARQAAIEAKQAELDARSTHEATKGEVANALAKLEQVRVANSAELDHRTRKLNAQDKILTEREATANALAADLANRKTTLATLEVEIRAREQQLVLREAAATTREVETKKLEEAAQVLKTDYEAKLRKLRMAVA